MASGTLGIRRCLFFELKIQNKWLKDKLVHASYYFNILAINFKLKNGIKIFVSVCN